ncbi:MAG: glycosyltransferase family 2 protein [Planctomycetaceae bacterium]
MSELELLPKQPPLEPVALGELPEQPTVSIVVPSFKQGRFIRDTLDSILEQKHRPLVIHVVDGNSPDNTVDVLKSYGDIPELKWVSEPDRGVVHAVNKGFARVEGDIIGIQSSDDMYLPGAIDRVVELFKQHPQVGLIYGDTVKVDAEGKDLLRSTLGPYSMENLLSMKTWIPQPSAFFRREMLEVCGGWDERIPYAPDTDLWIRMAFRTEVLKVDEFLSQRRMHDEQRDTQGKKIIDCYTQMVQQSPDIAAAPESLRRAAQVGCHLIQVRYNPTGSSWHEFWHKWQAHKLDKSSVPFQSIVRSGLQPIRNVLSKMKQAVLGQPTASAEK